MAHRHHGLADAHNHAHDGHDHFHDHSHSATASATSRAQLGLVLALMGGLLLLTSLYVWVYSLAASKYHMAPKLVNGVLTSETVYDYAFHMDAVALAGAILLSIPILLH